MLVKYKSDLSRPFDEATTFLNKIELQLSNLCTSSAHASSIRTLSGQSLSLSLSRQLQLDLARVSTMNIKRTKYCSHWFPSLTLTYLPSVIILETYLSLSPRTAHKLRSTKQTKVSNRMPIMTNKYPPEKKNPSISIYN